MHQIQLPGIVSAGIYNAQIALKNKAVSPNRKTTMFELELPIGEGGISYIDETSHPIGEDMVICAKPGQTRHTRLPFQCYYVHMIVKEGQLFEILSALPNYIELPVNGAVRQIFQELCEAYGEATAEDDLLLQSLVLKLVHLLNQYAGTNQQKHSPKKSRHQVIERTIAYIGENLTANLSLEALSQQANFAPIYFHKLFKASTGKNLNDYVQEQRVKKAAGLLISTEMTLTRIAYECGFSSQSYFSYVFRKRMGVTPRKYAQQIYRRYEE